jgi:DHA3 family macrolide efflux protein-like MFS transporter
VNKVLAPLRDGVLGQRRFQIVFLTQSLVELADQFLIVALAWTVLSTADGAALGLVLACWATPRGIFLLFGGVLVDRVDRRALGAACGVGLAVVVGGIGLLVALHSVTLGELVAAAVVLGLLDGIRLPIGYSLIPLVVEKSDVLDANRWSQLRLWATLTLGPAVGGVLTGFVGAGPALLVTGACYLLGSLFLLRLPALGVERAERTNLGQDFAAGLRVIGRNRQLRLLLPVFAVVNLFVLGITSVGVPLLVKHGLGASATGLGVVSGSFGVGLMLGTAIMPRFPTRLTSTMAGLFCLFVLSDGFLAATGLSPSIAVACVLFGLSGFFLGPASASYQAILQTSTPQEYLGRVTSMSRATSFGLEPLSAGLTGVVSRTVAVGWVIVVGGLAAVAVDVTAALRGRALDREALSDNDIPIGDIPIGELSVPADPETEPAG